MFVIKLTLRKRYNNEIEFEPLDDSLEFNTHNSVLNKQY